MEGQRTHWRVLQLGMVIVSDFRFSKDGSGCDRESGLLEKGPGWGVRVSPEPIAGIQVRHDVDALVRTIGKGNHLVPEIVKIG